jgi:ABC-type antimicrobial peptide transport system permease subunit
MFGVYLRRELRRRARQASIIAIGLALGIGLVITVTALSAGVKNAQGDVLHSLYGLDTDITVTQAPTEGSFTGGPRTFFGLGGSSSGSRPKAGTTISIDNLTGAGYGALSDSDVSSIAGMKSVAAAAGGLTLTDTKTSFTVPNFSTGQGFGQSGSGGSGQRGSFVQPTSVSVDGVLVSGSGAALGPLSSASTTSGSSFTTADANSDVAVIDSGYAKSDKLSVGSTVTLAKTNFKVIGIVSQPAASNPPEVYIPLERAQALGTSAGKSLKGDVNAIYVAADSASNINLVSKEISGTYPKATVTNANNLDNELTGSLSSASNLAGSLGKWLAIAVLVAAFLLASLLTTSAVSRRVREFGTLKALGWTSRRVVGQVVGEALVIGVIGGIVGVGLGFLGSTLVSHYTGTLTAAVGPTTGSATPGGARTFTGGFGGGGGGGFTGGGGGGVTGGGGGGFTGGFHRLGTDASHSVPVHLSAPVTGEAIAAAVVLAILGGLIAGSIGGWRAARLRPAMALARVE